MDDEALQMCVMPPAPVSSVPDAPVSMPVSSPAPIVAAPPETSIPIVGSTEKTHEAPEKEHEEDAGTQLMKMMVGMPHAASEFIEGVESGHEAAHMASDVMNPVSWDIAKSGVGGKATFALTAETAQEAARASGGAGIGNWVAPLALASGIHEGKEAIHDMSEHGANLENTPELVKAGLETTSGGIGTLGLVGAGL